MNSKAKEVLCIKKVYLSGDRQSGGMWRIILSKETMKEEDILDFELSAPFFQYSNYYNITLGVEENSYFKIWDDNPIASDLFNTTINGNVIIMSPRLDEFIAKIKPMLKKKGLKEDSFRNI